MLNCRCSAAFGTGQRDSRAPAVAGDLDARITRVARARVARRRAPVLSAGQLAAAHLFARPAVARAALHPKVQYAAPQYLSEYLHFNK